MILGFAGSVYAEKTLLLMDGTPVTLRLTEEISATTKNVGDVVRLEVARDVVVDGVVVIKQGTGADAQVNVCQKPDIIGQEGVVGITMNTTKAVDGKPVRLRANLTRSGENKEILSAGAAWVCCPIFGLINGTNAVYPVGAEIKAYTENDVKIQTQ